LFICLGNSCRSQMAEALARQRAEDIIVAVSAGTMALGFVAPLTLRVLDERDINIEGLHSKPMTKAARKSADIIINMTGSPASRVLAGDEGKTEDWAVADPYGEEVGAYRDTCDDIEVRLAEFAARLRAKNSEAPNPAVPGS
jgi:protein-tyrosine-phosphatase